MNDKHISHTTHVEHHAVAHPHVKEGRERAIFRVTAWCAVGNAALAAVKLVAGVFGNSAALVADAAHSLSDFASGIALVFFVRLASRPPDADHEFGHGKFETLATVIIGMTLFFVGFGLLASGGHDLWDFFRNGVRPPRPGWLPLAAAALSIVVKEAMYHWTLAIGRKHESSATIASAWDHRSDAFSSVGALIGVGAAFVFGEAWGFLDPLAAVGVSVVIIHAAVGIVGPALGELMEKSLPKKIQREILALVAENPAVQHPHKLRTRRIGPCWTAQVDIRVDDDMSVLESHKLTQEIEKRIHHKYGKMASIIIHVEPISSMRHHVQPVEEKPKHTRHAPKTADEKPARTRPSSEHANEGATDNLGETGFTLVEVLIALLIASLLIPATLAVFSSATRASARAENRCETRLATTAALQTTASDFRAGEKQNDLRIFPGEHQVVVRINSGGFGETAPPATATATLDLPDGTRETTTMTLFQSITVSP